jgi:hypothetical protein
MFTSKACGLFEFAEGTINALGQFACVQSTYGVLDQETSRLQPPGFGLRVYQR